MIDKNKLSRQLENKLPDYISGGWIKQNSGYESGLCKEIGWGIDTSRYFDAVFSDVKIEIKKGRSIWLDLVRYAEIVLGKGERDTITAFFIPNADRTKISDIYAIDTKDMVKWLGLSAEKARTIMELYGSRKRSYNMQARMTIADARTMAFYRKTLA